MINIREVITRPEYKWLDEYKDRLMFLTIGGSHAYGTNVATSDIDIRGVMLPTIESLIGMKREDQRQDEETDTVLYEFNRFVSLAQRCNPNILEMLGNSPENYVFFNDAGRQLVQMKNIFLNQDVVFTFGGYATSQLRRLQNANCHDSYPEEEKEKHILSKLQCTIAKNIESDQRFANKISTTIINDKIHLNIEKGTYPMREFNAAISELSIITKCFDKLSHRNSKKDDTHLCKHAMHLVRLYLMCFDILEGKGCETYRKNDLNLLMDIRTGKWNKENGQMNDDFFTMITNYEQKLAHLKITTTLPKKPPYRSIESFVIEINKAVVTGSIT